MGSQVRKAAVLASVAVALLGVAGREVSGNTYVEDFTTRDYCDTLSTTAWWDEDPPSGRVSLCLCPTDTSQPSGSTAPRAGPCAFTGEATKPPSSGIAAAARPSVASRGSFTSASLPGEFWV